MSRCPDCNAEMRPLLTGEFCPNDCDRRAKAPDPFELPKFFGGPDGGLFSGDWEAAIEEWYDSVLDKTPLVDCDPGDTATD